MSRTATGESVFSRVVRIVEAFDPDTPALRMGEIARRSELHVATTSRLVEALVCHGWLERTADRKVRVGLRLWELASRASPTLGLREAAMPFLQDLHAVVGHHAQLSVLDGEEVLFIERLSTPGAINSISRIAGRLPLHVSSSGLVLLAFAPAGIQERVLAGPLRAYTQQTITDPRRLRSVLADVRRNGYAYCPAVVEDKATGIAVPIRDSDRGFLAAMSIIVPNDENARMLIPALQTAARGITRAVSKRRLNDGP
ncbi:IclR family transcriptional regulator [Mycobacterium sp. 1245852.3]|uniref:IclR family transcriptional regulator n=1 Tax=Mycobacterium sp. 1245852.3 TaxID=1856860 RepID=UPI0007FBB15D|nr:IclR family transcriptional regulator [Mycobacterium sp. 1245852.3]OBJ90440.1 IclR family transcriptional regulator [Mycobacterium sp. 1245852.3]